MFPLHIYSNPYLGQLKCSTVAFILLVDVTTLRVKLTCGKFNWMGMIWDGTHVLIKDLTADNAYQSKHQALRSKELPVELRNCFASSHRSGKEFRKKFCCIEVSQMHVASIIHNRRCLEQLGLFLELASKLSNWLRRGLVILVTKKLMVTLVELHDHICRWKNLMTGDPYSEFLPCIYPIQSAHTAVNTHTPWTHTRSSHLCCSARGAVGGSVPCSKAPQSWYCQPETWTHNLRVRSQTL